MDVEHHLVQLLVHLGCAPLQVLGILAHFQAGYAHTAGVHSLAGCVRQLVRDEVVDSLGGAAHVGNFGHHHHLVVDYHLGVGLAHLVLCGAGQADVHLLLPGLAACIECGAGELVGVRSHDVVARCTELKHIFYLLGVQTCGVVDVSVGTGQSHHLAAEFGGFLGCAPSHVAEAGDGDGLALDVGVQVLQHALNEIECAETGSLRTDAAAAERQTLAGERTRVLAGQLLVHTVHISYLTAAYADIAGGNVAVGTEVAPQLKHESLAETHYLAVALAARAEVGTSLGTAHRQCGQGILECLLESQELQDGQCDGSVETDASLVRADRVVELHAIAYVVLNLALVVYPRHAEREDAVRFHHALYQSCLLPLRMLVVHILH